MAERVHLHLGLPKTATTYLQDILWGARDQLARDGVLLPGDERRDHLWASRVVCEDPHLGRHPRRAEEERSSWARLCAEIAAWQGTALISHEFFAGASAEQAWRMVEDLAPAQVELVVTAREPLGLFAASWQESLKNKAVASIEDYSRTVSSRPTDIWNWRTLDLRLVLERWSRAVPHDRIHVLPVDTSAPRDDIWHRFAGVLGLTGEAYDLGESLRNESMGVVEAETLRRVNAHLDSFNNAFDKGVYLRTFLADERLVPRGGERFWPSGERIEECRVRGTEAVAYLRAHAIDVVGDIEKLRVPDDLPPRRTPDSVTDAEMVATATELVAVLLDEVRTLRNALGQAQSQAQSQAISSSRPPGSP
ncbi:MULTISPECIES: hypothetical protein [unclassified Nocardioides]|uniref:hypothetical protein n=1 Tax=unclassified Nocardioides TaxID=2615069 RepID=UPI0006FD5C89|nr:MULTISPECIES: hypothetical protein [unclassified Nocardioides]KRA38070.1 hypothetical protein ASD81_05220 [Nocardioides sp. Root614]KRA92030.1 hypothetical protein ASD84_05485 [Nocardioides sp. Root682]